MTNPDRAKQYLEVEHNLFQADPKNLLLEQGFTWLVRIFAFSTAGLLLWLSWIIFQDAEPAIAQFGSDFLLSQNWNVGELSFGAAPFIYGTVVSSTLALLIAVPIGLAVAIVTSENFLPVWVRSPLATLVELIAAIPSVIVGLWGIYVMIPVLQPLQLWLYKHLAWIPLFSTEPSGPSMLAAGVILAIVILPTISVISRDVLLAIPLELRNASMSLGATRWETIFKIILPASASGIVGATILALGRALGETMAVTMVIGNSAGINISLLEPAYSITSVLANEFAEALEKLHIGALMYLALILFVITLIVNLIAVLMVNIFTKKIN